MTPLGAAALTLFPLLMAYAGFSDLFTMTISNRISLGLVAIFVVIAAWSGMAPLTIVIAHLSTGLAVLTLTFFFFARGWIGGGDAKLAAATAVWLGWDNLASYGLLSSLLGAALTVGILLVRKRPLPQPLLNRAWIARLHSAGTGVPYGIALAVAGLAIYPDSSLWRTIVA